jgi:GntR family transcriptional regulator
LASPTPRQRSQVASASSGAVDPRLPLYHRVREALLSDIQNLAPGDRLPTETALMERFRVSRTTIREAVNELVRTGLVRRRSGSGTFVAQPPIEQELKRLTGFVEDMRALRLEPTAEVVTRREVQADNLVAERLALQPGEQVMLIERIRLANGEPLSFDVTYLPLEIGRQLAQENLVVYPIFELLEAKHGIALGEADYRIEAANASARIARYLKLKTNDALLLIERTTYAADGTPIDYEQLHYRGDRVRYRLKLNR